MPDRAANKLFSSATLHPTGKEYVTISQKLLNASGARYIIFWMAAILQSILETNPPNNGFYQRLGLMSHHVFYWERVLETGVLVGIFACPAFLEAAGRCLHGAGAHGADHT